MGRHGSGGGLRAWIALLGYGRRRQRAEDVDREADNHLAGFRAAREEAAPLSPRPLARFPGQAAEAVLAASPEVKASGDAAAQPALGGLVSEAPLRAGGRQGPPTVVGKVLGAIEGDLDGYLGAMPAYPDDREA